MYVYTATVTWETEKKGTLTLEGKPDVTIATPPEFGGPEGIHSPEDLFVASLNACIMATFLTFAERTKTVFCAFKSTAKGHLEKVEGQLRFTKIVVVPTVEVPSEREKKHALHALKLVDKHCLITNSMNCVVEMHPDVIVVEPNDD
jgi:organic hydroperoxide reductase OsmC/OhrA